MRCFNMDIFFCVQKGSRLRAFNQFARSQIEFASTSENDDEQMDLSGFFTFDVLQHATSLVAQADREVQARKMLGQSEVIIAEQFAQASHLEKDNPMALQLHGMNCCTK